MSLATKLQLPHIVVASDCLQIINVLKEEYVGFYSMITYEIRAWAKGFPSLVFRNENRASNSEAHKVARTFFS
jgi:hypothetical protein